MSEKMNFAGQVVDYKESNDNAPPSYSSPCAKYKFVLRHYATEGCFRCSGTGYIGSFKSVSAGRCFQCLPDSRWDGLLGKVKWVITDDETEEKVAEIRYVTDKFYSESGFGLFEVQLPPVGEFELFPTDEEAILYAKKLNFDV